MHYSINQVTALPDGFRYPGQYTGQYGVYDAVRHLFEQHAPSKRFLGNNTVSLSRKDYARQMEEAVTGNRNQFRERHGIEDDETLIFVNLGNLAPEVEFSFEHTRKGLEEFFLKYSAPTSLSPIAKPRNKFRTVVSLQEGSSGADKFKDLAGEFGWPNGTIHVSDLENEHIEAMAASDFGISYDGQIVGQAAVCQLPTLILFNMRMHHQYYHDLFNRWQNNMNLIADKDIYPELIGGQAWYGKICDSLGEWYVKPGTRYELIEQWEYFIKDSLPKASGE